MNSPRTPTTLDLYSPALSSATIAPRRTAYILTCLPARKVLLMTVMLLFCFSVSLAVSGYVMISNGKLTDAQTMLLYFHIMTYLSITAISLFGMFAATSRMQHHSDIFCALLAAQSIFSLISGGLCLHNLFTSLPADQTAKCASLVATASWNRFCHHPKLMRGLCLGLFKVVWLLEILAVYIAHLHSQQLGEEEAWKQLSSPKEDDNSFFC